MKDLQVETIYFSNIHIPEIKFEQYLGLAQGHVGFCLDRSNVIVLSAYECA